jgi:hypothetical protein
MVTAKDYDIVSCHLKNVFCSLIPSTSQLQFVNCGLFCPTSGLRMTRLKKWGIGRLLAEKATEYLSQGSQFQELMFWNVVVRVI